MRVGAMEGDISLLTFKLSEGIRIFPCSEEIARIVDDAFDSYWKDGTEGVEHFEDYSVVKIAGLMCIESDQKSIGVKRAIAHTLRNLYCDGWTVVNSNVTNQDFSNLIQLRKGKDRIMEQNLICFSLVNTDYMQMIYMPNFLMDAILAVVKSRYTPGLESTGSPVGGVITARLKEEPWVRGFDTRWHGLRLMTSLVSLIERQGYKLYAVVNYNGNSETFYFEYAMDKSPKLPEYTMMSFGNNQHMEVYNLREDLRFEFCSMLKSVWPPGIGDFDIVKGVSKIPLNGKPWSAAGEHAISAQRVARRILEFMLSAGFAIHFCIGNKVLFRTLPAGSAERPKILSSLSWLDKERILVSKSTAGQITTMQNFILNYWSPGIKSQRELDSNGHEFLIEGAVTETKKPIQTLLHSILTERCEPPVVALNMFLENLKQKSVFNGVLFFERPDRMMNGT